LWDERVTIKDIKIEWQGGGARCARDRGAEAVMKKKTETTKKETITANKWSSWPPHR
jgi:hypothetical protein